MMTRVPKLRNAALAAALLTVVGARVVVTEDPRGASDVAALLRARESRSFKERLRKGIKEDWAWPGLRAAQTSWIWLELLQGTHIPESYEGDFSWMFSKLYTVVNFSNHKEIQFLTQLAPFYFVIGKDHAGATLFLDEMTRRAPDSFNVWFWGGFHALENLYLRRMAAHFYRQAAVQEGAPDYVASLSLRLEHGEALFVNERERRSILESNLAPEFRARLERARPEWFRN
jgi:hypothetical protein